MKLLLVEDDNHVASFIKKGFESEGFIIDIAYDSTVAKSFFNKNAYNVIILDVNIPGVNGFELCKLFKKAHPEIPIIFLTALDRIDDKVMGFESGADDYLVKPFEFKELLIRVKALSKRAFSTDAIQKLSIGDLELDVKSKTVSRAGKPIGLTAREFMLLEFLLINKNRIVSRVDITEKVWDINFDTNTNIIDVYINYLRKKIDRDFEHKLLHTVVGRGYILKEN
jgi:two-component system copper resistance phosphate regulon response regulator CusR